MKTITLISKGELKKKIDHQEDIQIVNVLSPEYYHLGFIKGSFKIPLAELENRFDELDKSKEVVVYCASRDCQASKRAAELLEQMGFRVSAYEGGIKEWKKSRFSREENGS